jgi:hypothetical protein
MTKQKKERKPGSVRQPKSLFRFGIFAVALLALAAATVIAKYSSPRPGSAASPSAASSDDGFVTVNVGGKRIRVNARTLQQGPLTSEQSQQIGDALQNNKSTDGLVEVKHPDGTVEMNLQGRFQNVIIAKKNDDGSVSTACVDNADAARSFRDTTDATPNRKAAIKE